VIEEDTMKYALLAVFSLTTVLAAAASENFSGNWKFDRAQSKNVGMMAQGSIDTVVTQSKSQVVVDDTSLLNGQKDRQHTVYDLRGKLVQNTSVMVGEATTRSHWEGARLITEWESAGAIAGTVSKRIETRYLSADGRTMYVESARPGSERMVIVFMRAR